MKTRSHTRTILAAGLIVATMAVTGPAADAQPAGQPLRASDFEQSSPRGFGDRNNSWAQSMVWWKGHLYVGTSRQTLCTSLYSVWQFAVITVGQAFADAFLPYPPPNPDLSCAPDGVDLSIQAEIWRWTPATNTWLRVFQSPLELDHPGAGVPAFPPQPGKKLPYEIAFRGLTVYTEPNGTQALYAFGVNSTIMWDRTMLPPPRILRSTDGLTFTPLPQTPGTFLGDFPFNPDHSSFRSPVSFKGKLFVLSGPVFGQGSLIGSANPAQGDDAWFLGSPPQIMFYEMAVFNGWLYSGTLDALAGYSVVKTRAEGPLPYQFVTVIPPGAYLLDRPSRSVVSMHVSLGRLYVGTSTQTELIRINPDDTWDLLVGPPREVPLPAGGSEWKYPLSGLDAGFGHTLNDHAWQMEDPYRYLYIGTYNASIASKDDPVFGPLLAHNMGAHLYRTRDGWYYSPITTNGFANPSDPEGGRFDYGIRTMASTPRGAFFGTANDYYGLMIFRAKPHVSSAPASLDRLEIESTLNGAALLSWPELKKVEATYQVWRAEIHPILVRDDANFEGWNGQNGNKIPDTYIGPYEKIAVTPETTYIDSTVQPGARYMYYIVVKTSAGLSEPSNLVTFPLLTPPVTFAQISHVIDGLHQRRRFRSAKRLAHARLQIAKALGLAVTCQIKDAVRNLKPNDVASDLLAPDATDLEILLSKLVRRLILFEQFPESMSASEFCTSGPI